MKFALLSETELRLVDLMFDAGAFQEVPVVVRPPEERRPAGRRLRTLVRLLPQVEAVVRRAGGVVQHGSIDDLLRIAEQVPDESGGRRP